MPIKEILKRTAERVTGIGRPGLKELHARIRTRKAWFYRFRDDGKVPNNPSLPLIHYRGVADLAAATDPAAVLEALFENNKWGGSWRNGIYNYVHYHPRTHEVLGIARGKAKVRFGGSRGKALNVKAGDVIILPAGTGHEALSASKDLLVVGAYPPKGKYDEYEGSVAEHARAVKMIPKVPLPAKDPVYGTTGAVGEIWRKKRR